MEPFSKNVTFYSVSVLEVGGRNWDLFRFQQLWIENFGRDVAGEKAEVN